MLKDQFVCGGMSMDRVRDFSRQQLENKLLTTCPDVCTGLETSHKSAEAQHQQLPTYRRGRRQRDRCGKTLCRSPRIRALESMSRLVHGDKIACSPLPTTRISPSEPSSCPGHGVRSVDGVVEQHRSSGAENQTSKTAHSKRPDPGL